MPIYEKIDISEQTTASAKLLVAGIALFVVSCCWFIFFLPNLFVYPVKDNGAVTSYFGHELANIVSVQMSLALLFFMIFLGILLFCRCLYPLVRLLPWICVLMFLFPFSCVKDLHFSLGTSRWTDPIVTQIQPCFITQKLVDYPDFANPNIEIHVFAFQYLFTPTFLIGVWGISVLHDKSVRGLFRKRTKLPTGNHADDCVYSRELSRNYGILVALLLLAFLPEAALNIFDVERQFWKNPPPNIYWNTIFIFLMLSGSISFYYRRMYFFALIVPFLLLSTMGYCYETVKINIEMNRYFQGESLIIIALFSRLSLGCLGFWIWWKNIQHSNAA